MVAVIVLVSAASTSCYQESVNTSNQTGVDGSCSQSYTGNYSFTNSSAGNMIFKNNTFDGNFSTSGQPGDDGTAWVLVNYTKPAGALSSSLWNLCANTTGSCNAINYSIPSNCWDYAPNSIYFRIELLQPPAGSGKVNATCYDGGWNDIYFRSASGTGKMWEDAMWWDITGPASPSPHISLQGADNHISTVGTNNHWSVKG